MLLFKVALSPRSHYYSSSLAPEGSKVKLYKLLSDVNVRQHRTLGLRSGHLGTPTAFRPKMQEIHHARKAVLVLGSGSVT